MASNASFQLPLADFNTPSNHKILLPTAPQPDQSLAPEPGAKLIPVFQKAGGSNAKPRSLIFKLVAWTWVSQQDYLRLSLHRWAQKWDTKQRSHVIYRNEGRHPSLRTISIAREVLNLPYGDPTQADHIDHDQHNNTRSNLRPSTRGENCSNRRLRCSSKTGFKGASEYKTHSFQSQIKLSAHGQIYLGIYPTALQAAHAYNHAAAILHQDYSCLNQFSRDESLPPEALSAIQQKVETLLRKRGITF